MTAQPRLLFMAKPQRDVLSAMVKEITKLGLDTLLGAALFAPENWHQSLSIRYPSEPYYRERLLRAGSRIRATSFSMTLDHIVSQGEVAGRIHWAFLAHHQSKGLQALLSTVQDALLTERLDAGSSHKPHVTISYRAREPLPLQIVSLPIDWMVEEILLVEGGGEPYHYQTIGRWPLLPPSDVQLRLL